MEKKVALGSLLIFGIFLIGAIIANNGGITNDFHPGMTGLVIAQGEEKPLALTTLLVIGLFISNIVTLFLYVLEKGKHMKDY